MNYNLSYAMYCDLALNSGLIVQVTAIFQEMTYSGWLEGAPWREINDRFVEAAREKAQRIFSASRSAIVIPPTRRDYIRDPGDMGDKKTLGGRTPEWLPSVTCSVQLHSVFAARDPTKDYSRLTVVWFQPNFAFPIADPELEAIKALDWISLAADEEY